MLRLYRGLPTAGVLAFQVPLNFAEPSHTTIREIAADGPWAEQLAGVHRYDPGFPRAEGYARPLLAAGAQLDVWTTTYLHVLSGPDPVFQWLSGTGLRPYFDALSGAVQAAFTAKVRQGLAVAYPADVSGQTLFPFTRLFVVAVRP